MCVADVPTTLRSAFRQDLGPSYRRTINIKTLKLPERHYGPSTHDISTTVSQRDVGQ